MKYNEVEYNNYLDNAVSVKNRIFNGYRDVRVGDLTFVPEKGHFEVKLPHKFRVIGYHNKKENKTHIGFFNGGVIGFSIFFRTLSCSGYEAVVKGNVDVEKFVTSDKSTDLLTFMYNLEERKNREARATATA